MGKKKQSPEKRTDAERRARQGERLSRHLRVLHRILGPGRWDADGLAKEMEVSPRTIHRILQTLAMANVPWYFCKKYQCYRVRAGFRFPGLEPGPVNILEGTDVGKTELLDLLKEALESLKKANEAVEKISRILG